MRGLGASKFVCFLAFVLIVLSSDHSPRFRLLLSEEAPGDGDYQQAKNRNTESTNKYPVEIKLQV